MPHLEHSGGTVAVPLGVFSAKPVVRGTIGYEDAIATVTVVAPPDLSAGATVVDTVGATTDPDQTLAAGVEDTFAPPESPSARALAEAAPSATRYEAHEVLGAGGMGEVVLARDVAIGRDVAVKRLHDGQKAHEAGFLREARIIGALEHPNIVPVHDVGVGLDGRPYFVMKHVAGETLEDLIAKLRAGDPEYVEKWSFEARIELFMGLLRALDYAHSVGVIHRDVKPANVMVGPYGEVVLMDWGIALRASDEDPARGRIVGTPYYMSPEQARGEALDARSDLYAASVVFHELVLLEHYLEPLEDAVEVLRAIGEHGWRWSMMDWMKMRPQPMPPMELYHFVRHGMRHDPRERFGSAREMLDELQRILEGRVRVQCHLTLVKRTARGAGRFVDRRPWIAFGAFAGTLGLALYGVASAVAQLLT